MQRIWRITLALLLCVITWLALTPGPPPRADLGWDKLNHLAAFATLAVVTWLAFALAWERIAAALLAYGALIEALQSLTPTRSAEWIDLLADAIGIAAGLLLVKLAMRVARRHRRPERPMAN